MRIEHLHNVEMLDAVMDTQRAMSEAQTEAELLYGFLRRFHELANVTEIMVLNVRDLAPDCYRIMDFVVVNDPDLSVATIGRNGKWDLPIDAVPVNQGGVVAELIAGTVPKLARDVTPGQGCELGDWIDGTRDILAVPVFFSGIVAEWLVVFREPGMPLEPLQIRVAVSMLNMLSRGVYQLKLTAEVRALHLALEAKLDEVASIQRSILPAKVPDHPAVDIAVSYRPSAYAGGDYYDFRQFDDGSIGLAIADVAGHGPAAAVVMAMLRTAMSIHRNLNLPAEDVASIINQFLWDGLSHGTFVTAFFIRFDPATGVLRYANAGHHPAYLRRANGSVEALNADGSPPLGVLPEINTAGGEATLDKGEYIVLYTDGVSETLNNAGEQLGQQRLVETIRALDGSAGDSVAQILAAADAHAGSHPQIDDQCLLVARFY